MTASCAQQQDFKKLIDRNKIILKILNSDCCEKKAMLVGGCVRDFLLSKKISSDIDISTTLKPEEVIAKVKDFIKKNKSNECIILDRDKKYGTIVVILNQRRYEITTTRSDVSCYGRQAEVLFCKNFHEDSNRRDFTINALYLDNDGKLYDFHNGCNDLNKKIIRFIGEPKKRIEEDYLRIVRLFRFAAKLNFFAFDKKTIEALKLTKNGLEYISRERIRNEVFKLLEYKDWYNGLLAIEKNNLIENIFLLKERKINTKKPDCLIKNKIVKLFYFFNFNLETISFLKKKLLFTREECKFADFLELLWKKTNNGSCFDIDTKMVVFHSKKEFVTDTLPLFSKKLKKQIKVFLSEMKPIKIDTNELIKSGFSGKQIGEKIKQLEKQWIESNFTKK